MSRAELAAPAKPWIADTRASFEKLKNCGAAVTAKIPNTTITMISSINVKPFCCVFINHFLFKKKRDYPQKLNVNVKLVVTKNTHPTRARVVYKRITDA